jgi:hypothetical protein
MGIAAPPVDLNQHIGHEPILQSVEVPVKQHLPTTTLCPFCRQEQLNIYVSPVAGGRWYHCRSCNFKGDSIEFYQQAHGLSDIRDAVYELAAKQILPMSKDELTLPIVNKYLSAYVVRRKSFASFFEEAQTALKTLTQDTHNLFRGLRLWDGFNGGKWHEKLRNFIGVGTRALAKTFGIKLPIRGFRTFLVCPFYDVSGRISSLLLIGKRNRQHRVYANIAELPEDDGLMMLGTLKPRNEVVYALDDPVFALHLQRRKFNISEQQPLPIIVYSDKTNKAWQSVYAGRVIYWTKEQDYRLFQQSRLHPRAFIAQAPRYKQQKRFLRGMPVAEIVLRFRESSLSWATTMKQFILTGEFWKVSDFMLNLALPAPDIQRIYDICTPAEKASVQQRLGETTRDRFFYIGNMKISEREDSWWITRGAESELGCNALIRIERAVHVVDTEENLYEGVVMYKGQQFKFTTAVDELEKRAADWLRKLLMDNAGVLRLARVLQPHLVEIAKQFHEPQYIRQLGRIGWDSDAQSFIFPNFSIRDGVIDSAVHAAKTTDVSTVPASRIHVPATSEGDWDLIGQTTPEAATLWAGLACFMANMIAPIVGSEPQPIGFVGGAGSVGCLVGRHLAKQLDMLQIKPKLLKSPFNEVDALNQRHGYPVWLDLTDHNRKATAALQANRRASLMTHLMEGEATALGVGELWVFVQSPRILAQTSILPSLQGALCYLAWLQRTNFDLSDEATSLQQCVLLSLKTWATQELHLVSDGVFSQAANMLRTFDTVSLDRRLMHLIYWLLSVQKLKMLHTIFYDAFKVGAEPVTKAHVLIDDSCNKLYINLRMLRAAVHALKLPSPNFDEAIRAFDSSRTTTGFEPGINGFVIDQPFWDVEVGRWRKLRT